MTSDVPGLQRIQERRRRDRSSSYTRRAKKPFGDGSWTIAGGVRWASFVYERVTISYGASFRYDPRLGMGETVNLDDVDPTFEKKPRVLNDFSGYKDSTAEMVVVQWKDREYNGKI